MKRWFKESPGFLQIDVIFISLFFVILVAFFMGVFPIFIQQQRLDYMGSEMVRVAEITGETGVAVQQRYQELKENTNITPKTISWDQTEYIGGSSKIQMNKRISLELTLDYELGGGGIGPIPMVLTSKTSGRSEVYYK